MRFKSLNLWGLLGFALLVRIAYLVKTGGLIFAVDTPGYLSRAEGIAQGIGIGANQLPLSHFYSWMISWAYVFNWSLPVYLTLLQLTLSTLTVGLVYLSARFFLTANQSLACGVVAALSPTFLFWMPYLLTETAFLFFFSLLLYFVLLSTQAGYKVIGALGAIVSLAICLFTRPVAVAIIPGLFAWYVVVYLVNRRYWSPGKAFSLAIGALVVAASLFFAMVVSVAPLRTKILSDLQVSTLGFMALHLETNSFVGYDAAAKKLIAFNLALPEKLSVSEKNQIRSAYVIEEIKRNPGKFSLGVVKRFFCFWFPGIWQGSWSFAHVVFDSIFGGLLIWGAVALFLSRPTTVLPSLLPFFLTMALASLCAFSHVDTDGRYRLPAEAALLILAPAYFYSLIQGRLLSSPYLVSLRKGVLVFFGDKTNKPQLPT